MANSFIKDFIKKTKPQFVKHRRYIKKSDWTDEEKAKKKWDEFGLQQNLSKGILDRLKYFVKKAEGDHSRADFKKFVKYSLGIINIHTKRVDSYLNKSDINKIEDVELKSGEIAFQNQVFMDVSKLEDTISSLNIVNEETNTEGIEFYNNAKAPLSMHHVLIKRYPEIQASLDEMGIDFDSPSNNKFHIYTENAPKWNLKKHYWQQEKDTLQYYVDEFKKIRDGIVVDGVFIHPWMYYHLNVFITMIPVEKINVHTKKTENKDEPINPHLRDNEWYIVQESYQDAKEKDKILFLAASRRIAKSTLLASHFDWCATIGKGELVCAGTNSKDLGQIAKNFKNSILHKNPAFAVYNITNDWTDKVELGIKDKSNKTIPLSTLNVVNLTAGSEAKSEIFAGYTPDAVAIDEVMKAPFEEQLAALKPALETEHGNRCVLILSGTGGNDSLSKDALKILNFPKANGILEMDWERLEKYVPNTEHITWKRRDFGTFIPAQMSKIKGCRKIQSNLADFLGKPSSNELRKIEIQLTDWKHNIKVIEERREEVKPNRVAHNKELVYRPIDPEEIFLSGKINPFSVAEAKKHKEHLLKTGLWDRRRDIYRDSTGKICTSISTRDIVEFPHKGGNIDAPFLLFEDLPEVKPKYGTYVAGFDDYKQDDSDTDSVSTFYVWKNEVLGDPFSKKLVASLSFKPKKHSKVHEKWLLLMEAFNLQETCFGENEDYSIKDYLDRRHLADKYLASSLDFSQTFNIPNNLKRKTGWTPRTTKQHLLSLFIDYCNEEFEAEDEEGNPIILKGVQRIDDIGLLDEIINFSENGNYDRITAAMGAVGYMHYLISSRLWKVRIINRQKTETEKPKYKRTRSPYNHSKRPRKFYRNIR